MHNQIQRFTEDMQQLSRNWCECYPLESLNKQLKTATYLFINTHTLLVSFEIIITLNGTCVTGSILDTIGSKSYE